MKRILVPTDLSSCSDNAVRYAIHFAKKTNSAIEFFHSSGLSRKGMDELRKNVADQYTREDITPGHVTYTVRAGKSFMDDLFEELGEKQVDLVVMGTHGASDLFHRSKASDTIAASPVPVLCVPCHSEFTMPEEITYFTDLANTYAELEQVKMYANLLKVKVSVVHFDYGWARPPQEKEVLAELKSSGFEFKEVKASIEIPLLEHIKKHLGDKNSLICLFHDRKNVIVKFFTGSSPEEAPLKIDTPVISFQRV